MGNYEANLGGYMSLDVYLTVTEPIESPKGSGIFVRENGSTREISEAEWYERHPDREPFRFIDENESSHTVYDANITHNLNKMAMEAGIYEHLWRPDEINVTKARELIEPLSAGANLLRSDPDRFKAFNPSNGWGDYEGLRSFVERYADACNRYPDADITVWR